MTPVDDGNTCKIHMTEYRYVAFGNLRYYTCTKNHTLNPLVWLFIVKDLCIHYL